VDTIFALATAPGRAAVAVVRASGPLTGVAIRALGGRLPAARRASVRRLKGPGGVVIDEALVLWMPGPASYTGEDSCEFHLHGGPAVISAVMEALLAEGLRPAEPGEFTRRAFENGKLDLAQAEAVADLVDAQTQTQARQALAQLGGALSARHEQWRAGLIEALAMLEAHVDFPDEELPADLAARAGPPLRALLDDLTAALADGKRGERVREGYRIALIGAPNAGKSSLLNALAGRDAAIVTEIAGTTRDIIEVPIDIAGYRVLLADTAGIREARDVVEIEGVRRAQAWAKDADLRLWLVDGSGSDGAWREASGLAAPDDIHVLTKADLPRGADAARFADVGAAYPVSLVTHEGLDALRQTLTQRVIAALHGAEFPPATRERHLRLLSEAASRLENALARLGEAPELAAEDVRLAARALGKIAGRIDPEDVLDAVFGKFCIGK